MQRAQDGGRSSAGCGLLGAAPLIAQLSPPPDRLLWKTLWSSTCRGLLGATGWRQMPDPMPDSQVCSLLSQPRNTEATLRELSSPSKQRIFDSRVLSGMHGSEQKPQTALRGFCGPGVMVFSGMPAVGCSPGSLGPGIAGGPCVHKSVGKHIHSRGHDVAQR